LNDYHEESQEPEEHFESHKDIEEEEQFKPNDPNYPPLAFKPAGGHWEVDDPSAAKSGEGVGSPPSNKVQELEPTLKNFAVDSEARAAAVAAEKEMQLLTGASKSVPLLESNGGFGSVEGKVQDIKLSPESPTSLFTIISLFGFVVVMWLVRKVRQKRRSGSPASLKDRKDTKSNYVTANSSNSSSEDKKIHLNTDGWDDWDVPFTPAAPPPAVGSISQFSGSHTSLSDLEMGAALQAHNRTKTANMESSPSSSSPPATSSSSSSMSLNSGKLRARASGFKEPTSPVIPKKPMPTQEAKQSQQQSQEEVRGESGPRTPLKKADSNGGSGDDDDLFAVVINIYTYPACLCATSYIILYMSVSFFSFLFFF
jgi:hypothetical protein